MFQYSTRTGRIFVTVMFLRQPTEILYFPCKFRYLSCNNRKNHRIPSRLCDTPHVTHIFITI